MPDSLSSSITRALHSLQHSALVVDSDGYILFANTRWKEFNQHYGFCPSEETEWTGIHAGDLFHKLSTSPVPCFRFNDWLQEIVQGESLISRIEIGLRTNNKGSRLFRLDLFPLLVELTATSSAFVLSLRDIGPLISGPPTGLRHHHHSLVPICASCKSIRNSHEEWIRIERFLQLQLSLQFTHDICPDCIRQLYPQYAGALKL